jgi:hypothetical protein
MFHQFRLVHSLYIALVLMELFGCRLQRVAFVKHHLLVRNPNHLRCPLQQDSVGFAVLNIRADQQPFSDKASSVET